MLIDGSKICKKFYTYKKNFTLFFVAFKPLLLMVQIYVDYFYCASKKCFNLVLSVLQSVNVV